MSVKSGFFNAVDHDRKYTADDMSEMFNGVFIDGVFRDAYIRGSLLNNKCFEVISANDEMKIIIGAGKAWFNNIWTLNDNDYNLIVPECDLLFDRWDAVCLIVDKTIKMRKSYFTIISGTPSEHPIKPALENTDTVFKYPIAYIKVQAGATEITDQDIENVVGQPSTPYVSLLSDTTALTIVNDLEQTEPGMVLDAVQGKVLNDRLPFSFKIDQYGNYGYIKNGEFKAFNGSDHLVNLGSGTSFDVSGYPQYDTFTEANFLVVINSAQGSCDGWGWNQEYAFNMDYFQTNIDGYTINAPFTKSYDPSTGIFTLSGTGGATLQSAHCFIWKNNEPMLRDTISSAWSHLNISYNVYLVY